MTKATIRQGYDSSIVINKITVTTDGVSSVYDRTDKAITLVVGDANTDYAPVVTGEIYTQTITPTAGTESIMFVLSSAITDTMDISTGKYQFRFVFDGNVTDLYSINVVK